MSQFPREECTACIRKHKRPYNSRCRYMKLAVEKCVELRCPTSDYRLYMPDLDTDWERPDDEGDSEEFIPSIPQDELDIHNLISLECQRQLQDTRAEMGN